MKVDEPGYDGSRHLTAAARQWQAAAAQCDFAGRWLSGMLSLIAARLTVSTFDPACCSAIAAIGSTATPYSPAAEAPLSISASASNGCVEGVALPVWIGGFARESAASISRPMDCQPATAHLETGSGPQRTGHADRCEWENSFASTPAGLTLASRRRGLQFYYLQPGRSGALRRGRWCILNPAAIHGAGLPDDLAHSGGYHRSVRGRAIR